MSEYRYKAFISYSHQDEAWGKWLQKALESYRIPRHMVGRAGEFGEVPARLSPVFRDREDLSSGADLTVRVREALEASETMIVICSPSSAQSRWVDEEIRHFQSLGRADRIYALVVDGDPGSADPAEHCFPVALLSRSDGSVSEPLAADLRKWADGKLLARLKLVSGILGIRLDDLRRRDMQRRHRLMVVTVGSALAISVVMTVLAVTAITARNAAENRREHAENLVGYMVGDLKTKLDEVGRLDILEGMGGKVSEYLQTLDPSEVTDESLNQQAQVWRQLGQVSFNQGELAEAGRAFTASRDILGELRRRNPEQVEYLFELGNAEFWIGYVHLELGEFDPAGDSFDMYLDYAEQLVEIEPHNPDWLMEKAFAHSNLAALINHRSDGDTAIAKNHIQQAARINKEAIELDPDNADYWSEYTQALGWLADTQLLNCDLGGAFLSRQETVEIARLQMERNQGNSSFRWRYALSLSGLASVAVQVGLVDLAIENYGKARDVLWQLSEIEPSHLDIRFDALLRDAYLANVIAETGRMADALPELERLHQPMLNALESESFENVRRHVFWVEFLIDESEANWRSGHRKKARELSNDAIRQLEVLYEHNAENQTLMNRLMNARFVYWEQTGQDILLKKAFANVEIDLESSSGSCNFLSLLTRQAILAGEMDRASTLTRHLLGKGYYEPGFVRVCRNYQLCE